MGRILSIDRRIWFLVGALVLIAAGIMFVKIHFLKFTLLPSAEQEVWLLECRVRFETPGGPVKAQISMPDELPGYFLTGLSTTPGFSFDTREKGNRLIAEWTGNADAGTQTILYQMRLIPDPYSGIFADSMDPPKHPVWDNGVAADSAMALLRKADPTGTTAPEVLVPALLKLLHDRNSAEVRTLLPENTTGMPFIRVAEKLLAMRDLPSRPVEGIYLVDRRRRQQLTPQLEVFYDKLFHRYDPVTGKQLKGDGFMPLRTGNEPILHIEGAKNPKLYISVLKTSISAANLNRLRGDIIRHSWLLDVFGFNLPLEEQNMFKQFSMLPLAILVIVAVRNLIGAQTMGTFMPVLIALAFLNTGLVAGLISFALIMTVGLLARSYLTRLNLLMVPRISAVVILVIILMKMISVMAYTFGFGPGQTVTFFPLIIIAWTIERASMIWDEDGARTALRQLVVSLLASLPCYWLMGSQTLQYFFFSFPEMNLIVLAVILLIGVYTGYRLSELKRFQPLVMPCSDKF